MMDDAMTPRIDPGNAGQLDDWDGEHGSYWAARADDYDASVARYQPHLVAAVAARPGERILDVGCGSGRLVLDLLASAPGSTAVGVDLSAAQLEVARARAGDLPVEFLQADAQVHDFGEAAYDVVVSRTGTMFFAQPATAFANLARATRPGGRLAMLVWRGIEANEWLREFLGAVGRVRELPSPRPDRPGPLALSDPDRTLGLLESAGWRDVAFAALDERMWFGADPDRATDFIAGQMAWLFATLDEDGRRQAERNLHDVMAAHSTAGGVTFLSGAWLVTARRRAA